MWGGGEEGELRPQTFFVVSCAYAMTTYVSMSVGPACGCQNRVVKLIFVMRDLSFSFSLKSEMTFFRR